MSGPRVPAAALAGALVVALVTAASGCSPRGTGGAGLATRLLPRGGTALVGPVTGRGSTLLRPAYHLTRGETVGVAASCTGKGSVSVHLSGSLPGIVSGPCQDGGDGLVGGVITADADGTGRVVVTAPAGVRWRVALYRAPVPIPLDTSTAPAPSATTSAPDR